MGPVEIRKLLTAVRRGACSVRQAEEKLRHLAYEDIGVATIDHHREIRQGYPETVLGEGKSDEQIVAIAQSMRARGGNILVTRVDPLKAAAVRDAAPWLTHDPVSRTLCLVQRPIKRSGRGTVLVITAGTSDIFVAEEAAITAEMLGNEVDRMYDVGVAGIHRLMGQRQRLDRAAVIIVVAGMEGALPSVVGGLVRVPVVAVPTSIGYGASLKGLAALLGMLNSCAAGVSVVNIDNGFGAGMVASLINRAEVRGTGPRRRGRTGRDRG